MVKRKKNLEKSTEIFELSDESKSAISFTKQNGMWEVESKSSFPATLTILQPKKRDSYTGMPVQTTPIQNEPSGIVVHPYGLNPLVDKATLWVYVRGSPEVQSIISAMVEDIVSDGYYLEGGNNKKKAAERFLSKNHFKEALIELLWDAFVTGDGYLWVDKPNEAAIKSAVFKVIENSKHFSEETKSELQTGLMRELSEDEDVFKPRSLQTVASSTLKIRFDNTNSQPVEYVQRVGAQFAVFQPHQILHFRPWRVDGKIYGFTPMQTITREMDILLNVKDLARYYFEKGGVPNFLFILKNTTPNDQNYKAFVKQLNLMANLSYKYKSIVLTTGDEKNEGVEVKELNRINKDMEFSQLAKYITTVLIMSWGIPVSRISDGLAEAGLKGSTASTEGYFRKISHIQSLLEDMLNAQLLDGFGVELKFNRNYLQDELREMQREKMATDVVEQRMRLGLMSWDAACKMLRIPEEERGDESLMMQGTGLMNQELLNDHQTQANPDKLADDNNKRKIMKDKEKTGSAKNRF